MALLLGAFKDLTHVKEFFQGKPICKDKTLDVAGAWDAGEVWVSGINSLLPLVWRVTQANEVLDRLVTEDNSDGSTSNYDREMTNKPLTS